MPNVLDTPAKTNKNYAVFDCGCKFRIKNSASQDNVQIEFNPDITTLNLECSKTWDLISSGNTKGCFQLESRLGQSMAKKLKPHNIEQLAGLISILRPGCLEAYRQGKSVSNHYIDKKNNLENIDYFHPSLEKALKTTYGEMIYQEQAMEIAQTIAGFDLKEADMLRKAIGKKKPEEMAKIKTKFLAGCKAVNMVSENEAEEIFGWIEKSQRYSFNKSHAVSYAMNAYLSAYAKAHFSKIFFASYLQFAKDKIDPQQEIKELVRNANEMDIDVRIPDLRNLNELFMIKNNHIYFGLTDIKGVGNSVFVKIKDIVQQGFDLQNFQWPYILFNLLININNTAAKALISCGSIDYCKQTRTSMLFDLNVVKSLTDKETRYCQQQSLIPKQSVIDILTSLISDNGIKIQKNRKAKILDMITSLQKPPYSLQDKIEWLSDSENDLLGTAITCSKLDTYDTTMTNCDCKTFKKTAPQNNIIIAAEVCGVNVVKTKKGKNPGQEMAFITIEDNTGILDSVIMFPETWEKYKHHIFINSILVFIGNKTNKSDGLIVDKCFMPRT